MVQMPYYVACDNITTLGHIMDKEQAIANIETMFNEYNGSQLKLGILVGYIRACRHMDLLDFERYEDYLDRTVSLKHG